MVLLLSLVVVAQVVLLGMFLVRRWVLRPISDLRTAASRIASGDFAHRIEVRGQAGKDELVDEKGRRMPQVEDQGVTQADRFTVIGLVLRQQLKEGLVAIEGGVKVIQDLGALGFRVRAIETWGTGEDLVSHHLGPGVWVSSTASSARLRGCQETTGLMACFVENNDMFIESFTWVEAA